jgi:hypothetical protein
MPMINAIGAQPSLSYHAKRMPTTLSMLPFGSAGACVCAFKPAPFGEAQGTLVYVPVAQPGEAGSGTLVFPNKCAPAPASDLLAQRNPTCDIRCTESVPAGSQSACLRSLLYRTYLGGQIACHHMFSLLDADQEIPWVDQPLTYQLKFRSWSLFFFGKH